MRYLAFNIKRYKAIDDVEIPIDKIKLLPLIGANESGKTSVLQAIFAFDYTNDNEGTGAHLDEIRNLYRPMSKEPVQISATVGLKKNELSLVLDEDDQALLGDALKAKELIITRYIPQKGEPFYKIDSLDLPEEEGDRIATAIVNKLPYIIYNDDFMDRPQSLIEIPEKKPAGLTGWLGIYEKACLSVGTSLFDIVEEEKNIRRSLLSDVSNGINKMLVEEWAKISIEDRKCLGINLDIEERQLKISIVEEIGGRERFFDVTERSKGFLWFFNFVMKIRYNPKGTGHTSDIIYLLDEPGSYLHAAAQEKLCKMLRSISQNDGEVIYCTHTHHLLNPKYIPTKNVYLVQKSKEGVVSLLRVIDAPTITKKNSELQPVYEALDIADWDFFSQAKRILLVEGIHDKYAMEFFCDLPKDVVIFPGTSASSIYERIPQCIAYGKKYFALWDNDDEGREYYQKSCDKFGKIESEKYHVLPKIGKRTHIRMEAMVGNEALQIIKHYLDMPQNSSYQKVMIAVTGLSQSEKRKVLEMIPQDVIQRFTELKNSLFS